MKIWSFINLNGVFPISRGALVLLVAFPTEFAILGPVDLQ
jgi:hypothetical protein